MKILFFSPVSSKGTGHNGGGWVWSLIEQLLPFKDLKTGIVFEGNGVWGSENNGVTVYPINTAGSLKSRIIRKFNLKREEDELINPMLKAVSDFQPDIIHIFGSENAFGRICPLVNIPSIIHIQGFLPSYENAKYPPGISRNDFIRDFWRNPIKTLRFIYLDKVFHYRAERESSIMKTCQNFFGRTQWDQAIVKVYNPKAKYFYCSEMLRKDFYPMAGTWQTKPHDKLTLVSVLSNPLYKGNDLILKTAKMLKEYSNIDFQWKIFGVVDLSYWEKLLKINANEVKVTPCGTVSAEQLKNELLEGNIYIHPSYIDNSPNSVCEAQLLGMPVVAVDVGGLSSLIEQGKNGILVPANDPVMLSYWIMRLNSNTQLCQILGSNAAITAKERHAPKMIVKQLLNAYKEICKHD